MKSEFQRLINQIRSCGECEELFGFKPNPVFGGNQDAKIVQISQAPSKNVHETKKAFNDASGKKLKYGWYKISDKDFYNGSNFYITGIGHCYPGKNKNNKSDKKPPIKCADKWLKKEIKLINNEIFIIIGSFAAKYFFPEKNFTNLVFTNQKINRKLAIILPHPSPQNNKWFKENPNFFKYRIEEIRQLVHKILFCQK